MSRFKEFLARLRQGVRDSDRDRLAAVLELNRALADARDLQELLVKLLDEAVQLFRAERGFAILRGEGEEFRVAAARSLDRESVQRPGKKVSSTVVRRCLDSRQGVFLQDAQEGEFGAAQSIADIKLRSVLCMPLLAGSHCLGCIYLDHRFQAAVFQEADLPWLQAFADQAAIAVHLHRLLEDNRAHAAAVEQQNHALQQSIQRAPSGPEPVPRRDQLRFEYPEICGESPALLRSLAVLDRVMDAVFPVLLVGESGTG
ncbi:MAG: GAF domain-containing protein, partial [Planctomycetes bacterium]|nr:GAF domain-containing protein [Planctomycetota bacterium]